MDLLKRIFRIEKITVISIKNNETQCYSTVEGFAPQVTDVFKADVIKLGDSLEVGKVTDITKQAPKYSSLLQLLKANNSNFAMKIREEHFDETFTLLYIYHFEYQSLKILFENSSLCFRITDILVRFADLVVEHSFREAIM